MSVAMNQTDRYIPVYYTGLENDDSTVINADLPIGGCVLSVELADSLETVTGQKLQKVTRPSTANLARAQKFIVAKNDNLSNVNAAHVSGTANRRAGGIVMVYNPYHPANTQITALIANSIDAGDSLIPADGSFALAENDAADAADIVGSIVGYAREANSSGAAALKKISLWTH